ncbi:MAG: NADH-quinone oxidoreductase subunit A [Deltaproteobacteria bacterium]|jgi:NAD(P)H-quinone oxidoreductase subunit 3|nr:NADH-quinone oxidoreductase subunit A [Deltaproteobacteria bacterium]
MGSRILGERRLDQWVAAAGYIAVAIIVPVSMLVAAKLVSVTAKSSSKLKTMTYECGEEPEGGAWLQFHPRYYLVALVFVLFDIEAVFLFPWALAIEELGGLAIVDMLIFVLVLLLGWGYALRKGALKWQ